MTDTQRTLALAPVPARNRLHADEAFPDGWRRVTSDVASKAAAELRRPLSGLDAGVHEARKSLKRLRALLRLVRFTIPESEFRQANERMRDIGRSLSGARDAWVLIETLAGVCDWYDDLVDDGAFASAERQFIGHHKAAIQRLPDAANSATASVLAVGKDLHAIGPLPKRFGDVGDGLGRVYGRALRAMHAAERSGDPALLHEWRKSVKTLRYQLEFLEPMQPALIGAQAAELDRLGELLGLDHDLVVLGEAVRADPSAGRTDRERWLLLALIHGWRSDLSRQAFPLGAALYAEPTAAFVARISQYWKAAHT